MSASNFAELRAHVGHTIECVAYGDENVALECVECNEVLVDFNATPEDGVDNQAQQESAS